jgi:hypothetical protein
MQVVPSWVLLEKNKPRIAQIIIMPAGRTNIFF